METGFINLIAETTARNIGLDITPTFGRWNNNRGHATKRYYSRENVFTLPHWLKNENRFYQIAYIAHEVCHFGDDDWHTGGHNPTFYENERNALASFDMEPQYYHGYRYVQALYLLGTKVPLWTKRMAATKLGNGTRLGRLEGR